MMRRAVLLLAGALMFGAFGIAMALQPERLTEWVGLSFTEPSGSIEIGAFYGGFELGFAAFLAWAAIRPSWRVAGCAALGCGSLGIALVRLALMISAEQYDGFLIAAFAIELTFGLLGLLGARRPKN